MTYETYISAIESVEKCCKIASDKMKELKGNEIAPMEKLLKERLIERFKDETLTNEARKSVGEELYRLGVKRVSLANLGSGSCAFYSTK